MDIEAHREEVLNPDNWEIIVHIEMIYTCGFPQGWISGWDALGRDASHRPVPGSMGLGT